MLGFCPNCERDASNATGKGTAYVTYLDHVTRVINNHLPGTKFLVSNCRKTCKKQAKNPRFCELLSPQEVEEAADQLEANFCAGDDIISLGGCQSNAVARLVKGRLRLSDGQVFNTGNHASTHVVAYSSSWTTREGQLSSAIKSTGPGCQISSSMLV